jgi:signal transduction histidine kinase
VSAVVEESIALVEQASSEIRDFSYLLHPPMLDEYGLSVALQSYVQGFSQRSGIGVDLDLPRDLPRLSQLTETALFRVVQESLTNVHRHSGSACARIRLEQNSGSLMLEVADEGKGMPSAGGARVGVGLAGIRARMRELGGRLEIETNSHGTTVRATLPLELEEASR